MLRVTKKSAKIIGIVFLVLFVDQLLKIWVKTSMEYGSQIKILGLKWALLHFVENDGMAFGITLGGAYGKLTLSVFRIIAVGFLIYYIRLLLNAKANFGLLTSFALILAGAMGNIIDSAFYGLIFSESYHGGIAEIFPAGGGYAPFLHGRVVDMLYFPILKLSGYYPSWLPIIGDRYYIFEFFKPVFNIADMSITCGVLNILFFQRGFLSGAKKEEQEKVETENGDVGQILPTEENMEGN